MQITINTAEMSPQDAAGLIALLGLQFPDALHVLEAAGIAVSDTVGRRVGEITADADAVSAFAEPSPQLAFGRADVPAAEALAGSAGEDAGSAGDAGTAPEPVASPPAGNSAPAAAAPDRGDLDADGIPWDARIHSEGKAKTKNDGKWRLKRNVPEATRAAVVAELKAAMGAPAASPPASAPTVAAEPPASPPPPPAPAAEPPPSPEPVAAPPPPPAPSPAPAAAPAPAAPAADGVQAFGAIMRKVTEAQTSGKLTAAETTALATQVGLESVRGLLARPDLIPTFETLFDAYVSA